jgi:hypothetical protein
MSGMCLERPIDRVVLKLAKPIERKEDGVGVEKIVSMEGAFSIV